MMGDSSAGTSCCLSFAATLRDKVVGIAVAAGEALGAKYMRLIPNA